MAVTAIMRQIQTTNRNSNTEMSSSCIAVEEMPPQKSWRPLHLSCGACPYCPNTCNDVNCSVCDNQQSATTSATLSDSSFSTTKSTSSGNFNGKTMFYTWCQVRTHNTAESAWLVAGSDIYDATEYLHQHPGGMNSILRRAGGATDCTEDIMFHSRHGQQIWKKYYVGKVKACYGAPDQKQWWQFWV